MPANRAKPSSTSRIPPAPTRAPTGGTGQIKPPMHPTAVEPTEPKHPYDPNDVS